MSIFNLDETHQSAAPLKNTLSVSARGTRKEEFEYLTKLFSGTRIKKGPAPWEKTKIEEGTEGDGAEQSPAHNKPTSTTQSPSSKKKETGEEGEKKEEPKQ